MVVGEDPKAYFARVNRLLNTRKSVGIVKKEEREIVGIIMRNLSREYDIEQCSCTLIDPN